MKKLLITSIAVWATMQIAHAEERYNHFPSLESADMYTAVCNIKNYNEKLASIVNKSEMSVEEMAKVHELTYTLENAVNFLKGYLEQVSIDLEDVHKASERFDQKVIKDSGSEYLESTSKLLEMKKC